MLQQIYDEYDLDIGQLGYIVAHGTGTKLGDSVELTALESVLAERGADVGQCALTSVKGNLGHTLAASGLVSVVALVEALRHKEIPGSLYCEQENDYINWAKSPLYVNKQLKAWESDGLRMGGVSSFGMSGTNAHVVLREYAERGREEARSRAGYLLLISGKGEADLLAQLSALEQYLMSAPSDLRMSDLSYSLCARRMHHSDRVGMVVSTVSEAISLLCCIQLAGEDSRYVRGVVESEHGVKRGALQRRGESLLAEEGVQGVAGLYELAQLYCEGYSLPWWRMQQWEAVQHLDLPAYPFARTEHWCETLNKSSAGVAQATYLHPFVHKNCSTLTQQIYRSHLFPSDVALSDEVNTTQARLSHLQVLEAVTFACIHACSDENSSLNQFQLSSFNWMQPCYISSSGLDLYIEVGTSQQDCLSFDLGHIKGNCKEIICQGHFSKINNLEFNILDLEIIKNSSDVFSGIEESKAYKQYWLYKDSILLQLNDCVQASSFNWLTSELLNLLLLRLDPQLHDIDNINIHKAQVYNTSEFGKYVCVSLLNQNKLLTVTLCDEQGKPCASLTFMIGTAVQLEVLSVDKQDMSTDFDEADLSVLLCETLAKVLKQAPQDLSQKTPFERYGLDSILGLSFVEQINKTLNITLAPTCIFEYSSVEKLKSYILQEYKDDLLKVKKSQGSLTKTNNIDGLSGPIKIKNIKKPHNIKHNEQDSIAIIGMSGQFSGADNIDDFWQLLVAEDDQAFIQKTQDIESLKIQGKNNFDSLFFGISPHEAELMHPHQRLILEQSWKCIEDASYDPLSFTGQQVSVFVGAEPLGYFNESFTGSSEAIIASRISHFLDLKGPALVVNTGCSSSAVAIHYACESLRTGESNMALAGGVYANLDESALKYLADVGMLSKTGYCATFDAAADGTLFSEAVGLIVLKRLSDAQRDNDNIYATIAASGVNQDGGSNGITAPCGKAQEELIVNTYRKYGVNPEHISYVEAHGTGTPLGDPVEVNALSRAFSHFTDKSHYCLLGSLKPMVGHTLAASGVVSMIKVVKSMQNGCLPGLKNFSTLNPNIHLERSPFYLSAQSKSWQSEQTPLMAAISSFGHSGTNAHFVLQEYSQSH
ncbi:hypothetical protein PSECIP111854_03995 [Pseudoalteromonas sp. CIP111854]|uniref:Uncharacterized protein n=1 Tax=Pseudoalteromonas holothuriae TaxID=2963714 RepID=A0A9W4VW41_9GAMM|nr:hypothetical protein PSECIP111854_03995 [Pseudoalteromonas sp. CIP111854]